MRIAIVLVVLLVFSLLAACGPASTPEPEPTEAKAGMANPASVHCEEEGGTLEIRKDAEGNEIGYCIFPDGSECEEWAFFRGECEPGQK